MSRSRSASNLSVMSAGVLIDEAIVSTKRPPISAATIRARVVFP